MINNNNKLFYPFCTHPNKEDVIKSLIAKQIELLTSNITYDEIIQCWIYQEPTNEDQK